MSRERSTFVKRGEQLGSAAITVIGTISIVLLSSQVVFSADNTTVKKASKAVQAYRKANEHRIIGEFRELLEIPNVSVDRQSIRKNAGDPARYEVKEAKNGNPYFVLKAANHQVIGQSGIYSSAAACENGMESVAKNAADATIDDQV